MIVLCSLDPFLLLLLDYLILLLILNFLLLRIIENMKDTLGLQTSRGSGLCITVLGARSVGKTGTQLLI